MIAVSAQGRKDGSLVTKPTVLVERVLPGPCSPWDCCPSLFASLDKCRAGWFVSARHTLAFPPSIGIIVGQLPFRTFYGHLLPICRQHRLDSRSPSSAWMSREAAADAPIVSSTSAGRWEDAENTRVAFVALTACLPFRHVDRARACRSIVVVLFDPDGGKRVKGAAVAVSRQENVDSNGRR